MEYKQFITELSQTNGDEELLDFCRKEILHGLPYIFEGKEDDYYKFRKSIAEEFHISFHEVYITGSAKLGFSAHKATLFDLNSDIDTAIVSNTLFELFMNHINIFQWEKRKPNNAISKHDVKQYHKFLEYTALGWIRPDLLPVRFQMNIIRRRWFQFFNSISNGKSYVGNYQVNAGIFKSYKHFETYTLDNLVKVKRSIHFGDK